MAQFTKQQTALIDPIWDFIEVNSSYTWDDILKLVNDAGFNIKNWMSVRNVMASINHELGYVRDADITVEKYVKS